MRLVRGDQLPARNPSPPPHTPKVGAEPLGGWGALIITWKEKARCELVIHWARKGPDLCLHLTGICPAAYSYDPSQGKGSLPATPASPSQALLAPESRGVQASLMSNIITKVPKGSMLTSLLYGSKRPHTVIPGSLNTSECQEVRKESKGFPSFNICCFSKRKIGEDGSFQTQL